MLEYTKVLKINLNIKIDYLSSVNGTCPVRDKKFIFISNGMNLYLLLGIVIIIIQLLKIPNSWKSTSTIIAGILIILKSFGLI